MELPPIESLRRVELFEALLANYQCCPSLAARLVVQAYKAFHVLGASSWRALELWGVEGRLQSYGERINNFVKAFGQLGAYCQPSFALANLVPEGLIEELPFAPETVYKQGVAALIELGFLVAIGGGQYMPTKRFAELI